MSLTMPVVSRTREPDQIEKIPTETPKEEILRLSECITERFGPDHIGVKSYLEIPEKLSGRFRLAGHILMQEKKAYKAGCFAGALLLEAGVPGASLMPVNGLGFYNDAARAVVPERWRRDMWAMTMLRVAQERNDMEYTWGQINDRLHRL